MGREDEALRQLVDRWHMLTLAVREQITAVAGGTSRRDRAKVTGISEPSATPTNTRCMKSGMLESDRTMS
jgi:hypothetical protein